MGRNRGIALKRAAHCPIENRAKKRESRVLMMRALYKDDT